ncbi:MAG: diadenylate cyclase [Bacilli bacterium]
MNIINFIFTSFTLAQWLDFAIGGLLFFGVSTYIFLFVRRKFYGFIFLFLSIAILVSYYVHQFALLSVGLIALFVILTNVFVVLNATELKAKIDLMFKFGKKELAIRPVNYDKEMVYELIYDAVSFMSKNKIGALITMERTTKLDSYTKNGVVLNAPITAEMLTTIFYPGTRLHDGAVIIRGSFILAANVYYQPTTKPFLGKLGSRHRAAIGISESTDAVTIVVSEETGRLSLTYGGQLEPVYLDTFKQTLANYMENRPHFENN